MDEISLYLHIPFCISKCFYCAFNSYPLKYFNNIFLHEYFDTVFKELDSLENFKIKTIYIGGGTPSVVSPHFIENLLNKIYKKFSLKDNIEISMEVNPATVNNEKLKTYKNTGINRISIGIQSFNNTFLKLLGRAHSKNDAIFTIELAQKNFENISFDLMFGLPNQKIKDLKKDIEYIKIFQPKHISYYCLSIDEGTTFYYKNIEEISDKDFDKMFKFICNELESIGFEQYEISNFSKKNFQCKHNLTYWNYENYIGIGAGAVSFIKNIRYKNISRPENYIKNFKKKEEIEKLSHETMEFEYIFMNLRKTSGIDLKKFKEKFNINFLEKYKRVIQKYKEYLIITKNKISFNIEGFAVSNYILSEFKT